MFKVGRDGGEFASGISLVTQGMLESPHFLYMVEGPGALTQHQLAARMSYFLWNGPPDADWPPWRTAGVAHPEALRVEARRMLVDRAPRPSSSTSTCAGWALEADLDTRSKDERSTPTSRPPTPYAGGAATLHRVRDDPG